MHFSRSYSESVKKFPFLSLLGMFFSKVDIGQIVPKRIVYVYPIKCCMLHTCQFRQINPNSIPQLYNSIINFEKIAKSWVMKGLWSIWRPTSSKYETVISNIYHKKNIYLRYIIFIIRIVQLKNNMYMYFLPISW